MTVPSIARSIDTNEWKQPKLLMTSIGENEKDEELDDGSDIQKLKSYDSNFSKKFMTI